MRKRLQIFCLLLLPCLTLAGLLGRGSPAALTAGDAAIPASADNSARILRISSCSFISSSRISLFIFTTACGSINNVAPLEDLS